QIAMEGLTQAERNVVYAVRDFARFRKDFYVTIVTGTRALVLPGTGGGAELAFLIRGERSPTVGFNTLLLRLQLVRNQETNVRSLEGLIRDLEQLVLAGRSTALDITQLQSSLESARQTLAIRKQTFANQLDSFKVQLGLPPDIEIELNDSALDPFQFVNVDLLDLEDRIAKIVLTEDPTEWAAIMVELKSFDEELAGHVKTVFAEAEQMQTRADPLNLDSAALSEAEQRQMVAQFDRIKQRIADSRKQHRQLQVDVQQTATLDGNQKEELLGELREYRRGMLTQLRELLGVQISVRVGLVELKQVDLTPGQAVEVALNNRLDLMNRQAFVVDARRQIEIAADRLEATINLVAEGEVNTPPLLENSNPLEFRATDSNFRVGVSVITPLDRVQARNNFRAAQIAYQRARRNYMAAEDQVKLDVRTQLRAVVSKNEQFDISRRALRVAARELDQAVEFSERPGTTSRAGNQGVNISRALNNILLAQNQLIDSWVDYERGRLGLFRDLGIMEIGENGLWTADHDRLESQDYIDCPWEASLVQPEEIDAEDIGPEFEELPAAE
ncbi:MAG: TolC family protein, partial [Pirellulales bacterium]